MHYFAVGMVLFLSALCCDYSSGYSAQEDARIIAEYLREQRIPIPPRNHAKIARRLVHQSDWSAVGTLSANSNVLGYPMVNMVAVADSAKDGNSTGVIYFLLTDFDFTGQDWKAMNKVTFFFSDDQLQNCKNRGEDPMEPTCARAIISGQVQQLDENGAEHAKALLGFISRHPAAVKWIKVHQFYLCKLNIQNVYVVDFYGPPHFVAVEKYYNPDP